MKTLISILILYLSVTSLNVLAADKKSQIEEIAKYIEISIENQNPDYINSGFNYDKLCQKIVLVRPKLAEFNNSFKKNIAQTLDPGYYIIKRYTPGSSYELISSYAIQNRHKLIYRLNSNQGVDYHEYTLSLIENEWYITNIYLYYDAISLENMTARYYKLMAMSEHNSAFSYSEITELSNTVNLEKKLMSYLLKAKYKKVLLLWAKQPESIKYKDEIFHFALRAISYTNPEELISTMDNSNLTRNKKNRLYLTALDGLYEQQSYYTTLNCIDQLDSAVKTDPYLNLFRASVYKAINDSERSKWCLQEVINNLPEEEAGYIGLLELYIEGNQFSHATQVLNQITDQFGLYKSDLDVILEKYPGFTNSSEYAGWIAE